MGPQIVYPFLVIWNFITNTRSMSGDMDAGYGILAVTSDGGRILLSSKPFQRKVPVEVLDTVPPHTTFTSDAELMETYLIPTVTVDRLQLVVNRIDFKVLLKAIEAGRVIAPEILAVLPRLKAAGAVRDTPR